MDVEGGSTTIPSIIHKCPFLERGSQADHDGETTAVQHYVCQKEQLLHHDELQSRHKQSGVLKGPVLHQNRQQNRAGDGTPRQDLGDAGGVK